MKWHERMVLDDFQPAWRISNGALIGLYTIRDTKMSREEIRGRYMPDIKESLALLDRLIAFTEDRPPEKYNTYTRHHTDAISEALGTSDRARIRAELEDARRELLRLLDERQTEAPKATRILEIISTVASAKVRAIARR